MLHFSVQRYSVLIQGIKFYEASSLVLPNFWNWFRFFRNESTKPLFGTPIKSHQLNKILSFLPRVIKSSYIPRSLIRFPEIALNIVAILSTGCSSFFKFDFKTLEPVLQLQFIWLLFWSINHQIPSLLTTIQQIHFGSTSFIKGIITFRPHFDIHIELNAFKSLLSHSIWLWKTSAILLELHSF